VDQDRGQRDDEQAAVSVMTVTIANTTIEPISSTFGRSPLTMVCTNTTIDAPNAISTAVLKDTLPTRIQ
jgi:hypothetical protein